MYLVPEFIRARARRVRLRPFPCLCCLMVVTLLASLLSWRSPSTVLRPRQNGRESGHASDAFQPAFGDPGKRGSLHGGILPLLLLFLNNRSSRKSLDSPVQRTTDRNLMTRTSSVELLKGENGVAEAEFADYGQRKNQGLRELLSARIVRLRNEEGLQPSSLKREAENADAFSASLFEEEVSGVSSVSSDQKNNTTSTTFVLYGPKNHYTSDTATQITITDRDRIRTAQPVFDQKSIFPKMYSPDLSHDLGKAKTLVKNLEHIGQDEYLAQETSYFKPRGSVINNFIPELKTVPRNLCADGGDGPFLLIVVPSIQSNVKERQAVRDTWASPVYGGLWPSYTGLEQASSEPISKPVKLVFVLGKSENSHSKTSLAIESDKYGDILQAEFVDSYRNLTLKMATVLYWTATYCPKARFLMKVDEDTFVNLPLLLEMLDSLLSYKKNFVLGYKHYLPQPQVPRDGKWKTDQSAYPFDLFPQYLYGHSYVISGGAVPVLLTGYKYMPAVEAEDVFVTGILPKTMDVDRIHSPNFANIVDHNRCDLLSGMSVSQTSFKPYSALYKMWEIFKTGVCSED